MAEKKVYSMKEVFEKTGLNRRQVFEFKDVVPPVGGRPVGCHNVEYKLYDDEGIKKLQIIAIFRQLHIPNVDIKNDGNTI